MNTFNPFLSFAAIALEFFSYISQIPVQRLLDFPDNQAPLLVFFLNEISDNAALLVNKTSYPGVAGLPLVDVLGNHFQSHLLAPLALFLEGAVRLQMIEGNLFTDLAELNHEVSTICLSS